MANSNNDNENNSILEVNENVVPGTRSPNENLQYRLATERNRLRWEHQEKYEKAEIESYINEDAAAKQRRSIRIAVKMSEIVLNIQEALHSGIEHDLPRATESFKMLLNEPFTTMSLLYAPCVVKTVYLCCRYMKSSEVRELAKKCYNRFRPCFGVPYGETFETTFQSSVRNFWEKQDTVIYDTTKYDHRQFTMNDYVGNIEKENEKFEMGLSPNGTNVVIKEEIVKTESDIETDNSQYFRREEMEITPDIESSMGETAVKIKTECENEADGSQHDCNVTIKTECENETDGSQHDCNITIKQEIMDTDEFEIGCTVKPESITDMLEISVKSEPPDYDEPGLEYDLDKCKVSSFKSENTSDIPELSVKVEPIDFEKLNIQYDYEKDCYIINSP